MNATIIFTAIIFGLPTLVNFAHATVGVCDAIFIDEKFLDMHSLKSKASTDECRRWKKEKGYPQLDLDLNFSGISKNIPTVLHLTRSLTQAPVGFPDFIRYAPKEKTWSIDDARFSMALNNSPVYQNKAAEMLKDGGSFSTKATFKHGTSKAGKYLIMHISYLNTLTDQRWNEGYFSFVQPRVASVFYNSPTLLSDASGDRDFLRKLTELFMSMNAAK